MQVHTHGFIMDSDTTRCANLKTYDHSIGGVQNLIRITVCMFFASRGRQKFIWMRERRKCSKKKKRKNEIDELEELKIKVKR